MAYDKDNYDKDFIEGLEAEESVIFEEQLKEYFSSRVTPIPEELESKISNIIDTGMINNKKSYPRVIAIALIFIGLFIASVKWIPAFGVYASNIPIIKIAVDWLQGDSGTEHAKNQGYKELKGITLEEAGIKLELNNIMFDEDRLVVSATASGERIDAVLKEVEEINKAYSEESLRSLDHYSPKRIGSPSISILYKDFQNPGGIGQSYFGSDRNMSLIDVRYEKIFEKGEAIAFLSNNPKYLTIDVEVIWYMYPQEKEELHIFKDVKIPFDKSDFMESRHYSINEVIPIAYGELKIDELTISPTRMRVDVSFDMEEGYKFNGLEKPYLMDAKDNKYMTEGLVSTGGPNKLSYYIVPSIYFNSSINELYFGFEEYSVGEDKDYDFTISLNEELPKAFNYMGEDIIVETVSYRPNTEDKLWIDLLMPSTLRNNSGLGLDGDISSSSWTYREVEGDKPRQVSFGLNIEERDLYQFKLQSTGYRYHFNKTIRIDTK